MVKTSERIPAEAAVSCTPDRSTVRGFVPDVRCMRYKYDKRRVQEN